ncbi:hypothetical protein HK101_005843, partial [Irineochytrium annulatum]
MSSTDSSTLGPALSLGSSSSMPRPYSLGSSHSLGRPQTPIDEYNVASMTWDVIEHATLSRSTAGSSGEDEDDDRVQARIEMYGRRR